MIIKKLKGVSSNLIRHLETANHEDALSEYRDWQKMKNSKRRRLDMTLTPNKSTNNSVENANSSSPASLKQFNDENLQSPLRNFVNLGLTPKYKSTSIIQIERYLS